jgi:hypothetical protein
MARKREKLQRAGPVSADDRGAWTAPEIAAIDGRMASAPAYQEACMDSTEVTDYELLDAASRLLMASLRQSRDLNIEIRQALQRREQACAGQSDTTVFDVLRDVIDGASHQ